MSSLMLLQGLLVIVRVSSGAPSANDQTRIVGGIESAQGKWPFFAGLFYKRTETGDAPFCGAVIWDKDTLLTAAHCVSSVNVIDYTHPELFDVYMGNNSWTEPRDINYMFKVKEIIPHPDYKGAFRNDIALIFLDRSIDFDDINRKVQCVCDPEPLDYLCTSDCVAIGWGLDDENKKSTNLMEVVLPILDSETCYMQDADFDPNHHLCAGYVGPFLKTGTCFGDSGGPLVCPQLADPSKFSLVGISSFIVGSDQAACGQKPSFFANVKLFQEWIASVQPKTSNVQTPPQMSSSFGNRWFGKFGSFGKWW